MTTSATASATPVALVHGVGYGPSTFARVARELRRSGPVLVVERRGYGTRAGRPPPDHVADHVADLLAALDAAAVERAIVAGSSGGATIALAAALIAPDRVEAAVAHEPAVGSLNPELVALIRTSVRAGGTTLVRALAGPLTWACLTDGERAALASCADLVAEDTRAFLAWEPPLHRADEAAPVITTVGRRSPPLRHAIAAVLRDRIGARVAVLEDCGHLAQLDAPAAFAATISAAASVAVGATSATV